MRLASIALCAMMAGNSVSLSAKADPLVIRFIETEPDCRWSVDGNIFADNDVDAVLKYLEARTDRKRAVRIESTMNTPWRCVGGVIYRLQMAGYDKIEFLSQPDPETDGAAQP